MGHITTVVEATFRHATTCPQSCRGNPTQHFLSIGRRRANLSGAHRRASATGGCIGAPLVESIESGRCRMRARARRPVGRALPRRARPIETMNNNVWQKARAACGLPQVRVHAYIRDAKKEKRLPRLRPALHLQVRHDSENLPHDQRRVTVFGDCITSHGGAVMLTGLIKLLAPFGMNHRLVRTNVHRLQREGWLTSKRLGRLSAYSLTPKGLRRFTNAYKRVYAPPVKFWDGNWTGVFFPASASGQTERKNMCRDLEWEGFGTIAHGVFVHPRANPVALQEVIASATSDHSILVLSGRNLGQLSLQPVQNFVSPVLGSRELATGYLTFLSRFEPIQDRIRNFDQVASQDAFALRTLLIHHLRRVALHDPLLQSDLLPHDWPGSAHTSSALPCTSAPIAGPRRFCIRVSIPLPSVCRMRHSTSTNALAALIETGVAIGGESRRRGSTRRHHSWSTALPDF